MDDKTRVYYRNPYGRISEEFTRRKSLDSAMEEKVSNDIDLSSIDMMNEHIKENLEPVLFTVRISKKVMDKGTGLSIDIPDAITRGFYSNGNDIAGKISEYRGFWNYEEGDSFRMILIPEHTYSMMTESIISLVSSGYPNRSSQRLGLNDSTMDLPYIQSLVGKSLEFKAGSDPIISINVVEERVDKTKEEEPQEDMKAERPEKKPIEEKIEESGIRHDAPEPKAKRARASPRPWYGYHHKKGRSISIPIEIIGEYMGKECIDSLINKDTIKDFYILHNWDSKDVDMVLIHKDIYERMETKGSKDIISFNERYKDINETEMKKFGNSFRLEYTPKSAREYTGDIKFSTSDKRYIRIKRTSS